VACRAPRVPELTRNPCLQRCRNPSHPPPPCRPSLRGLPPSLAACRALGRGRYPHPARTPIDESTRFRRATSRSRTTARGRLARDGRAASELVRPSGRGRAPASTATRRQRASARRPRAGATRARSERQQLLARSSRPRRAESSRAALGSTQRRRRVRSPPHGSLMLRQLSISSAPPAVLRPLAPGQRRPRLRLSHPSLDPPARSTTTRPSLNELRPADRHRRRRPTLQPTVDLTRPTSS